MTEGRRFKQQYHQDKMVFQWKPMSRKRLESFIRHNTTMFIENVIVRRLTSSGYGNVWSFELPNEFEQLMGHVFDLSLGNNIIDYCCGTVVYDEVHRCDIRCDTITVVESKNGHTNITPDLIDVMSERYGE